MLFSLEETKKMILQDKVLHIAGDESLLSQLPKGNWIGGTTPYFITDDGGLSTKDKLFVNVIEDFNDFKIEVYKKDNILSVSKYGYDNGLVILVMPFGSKIAAHYAKEAQFSEDILMYPTIGWIAGFDLSQGGAAKVYNGVTGKNFNDEAVALHISLPEDKIASIGVVNIFDYEKSNNKIRFYENALSVDKCTVDGVETSFADYLTKNNIDIKLPLIADYNGVLINTSIKNINENNEVELYAPVFADYDYYFANNVADYAENFKIALENLKDTKPLFSCNCILNYLYGELEGKSTKPFAGPVTFGEIAYQLLNQTLVYVEII